MVARTVRWAGCAAEPWAMRRSCLTTAAAMTLSRPVVGSSTYRSDGSVRVLAAKAPLGGSQVRRRRLKCSCQAKLNRVMSPSVHQHFSYSVAKLRRLRSFRERPVSDWGSPMSESATPPSFISVSTCATRGAPGVEIGACFGVVSHMLILNQEIPTQTSHPPLYVATPAPPGCSGPPGPPCGGGGAP